MPVASSEYQHQEQMYCAEQINIPVALPNVLKSYAKAAMRTQPYDLLRWTSAYFRALANGEVPPVKARLEYPPDIHPSGITPHFLKALLNQYAYDSEKRGALTERTATSMPVTLESLLRRWRGMALSDSSLYSILMTGRLLRLPGAPGESCDLYRFLAIACGLLGNNLLETMIYVCELLSEEPEGGSAMIPLKTFMKLYEYLANLDCSGGQSITETGPRDAGTIREGDEASLLRSCDFSSAASAVRSNFSGNTSASEKEVRGRTNDISSEDSDIQESLCNSEVRSCVKAEEEMANRDKTEMNCQPSEASDLENSVEAGEPAGRRRSDSSRSTSSRNSLAARKLCSETETTRAPQPESRIPSGKSTYNDKKKRSERELPEGTLATGFGGSASASLEVTKVQEERRRRRDVELHSSTEEVRTVNAETTAEQQPLRLLDSPHSFRGAASSSSSPSSSSSSSFLGKSHVSPPEPVKAADSSVTAGAHHRQTDKILATRSLELRKQVEGVEEARKEPPSAAGNITGSITARKSNVERSNAGRNVRNKNLDKSAEHRMEKIKRKASFQVDVPGSSFEHDDPTSNGNRVARDKKSRSRRREETKDSSEQGERIEDEAGDPVDYAGEESSEEGGHEAAGMYSEGEQVEDMAEYQPIGLENILEGICECLEPTKGTTNPTIAAAAPPPPPPHDLVLEFIEGMRAKSPAGPYIPPEVPGIGPPVSPARVTDVGLWLNDCARRQEGYVAPRNLRHFLCPNLDESNSPRCEDYCRTITMCP